MKRLFIPVEESFQQWKKDPKFVASYDALAEEFAVASLLMRRENAGLSTAPFDEAERLRSR